MTWDDLWSPNTAIFGPVHTFMGWPSFLWHKQVLLFYPHPPPREDSQQASALFKIKTVSRFCLTPNAAISIVMQATRGVLMVGPMQRNLIAVKVSSRAASIQNFLFFHGRSCFGFFVQESICRRPAAADTHTVSKSNSILSWFESTRVIPRLPLA